MKQISLWGVFLLSLIFVACSDDNDSKVNELTISLDKKEVIVSNNNETFDIQLTSNGDWVVKDVPNWINMNGVEGGNGIANLTLGVESNGDISQREANIRFIADKAVTTLKVIQKRQGLVWSNLNFSRVSEVESILGTEPNESVYNFKFDALFVNPSSNTGIIDKLFLGNIVNRNLTSNTNIATYEGYTFIPITIFTSAPINSEEIIPSKKEQDAYVKKCLESNLKQSESFYSNGGSTAFFSYRELNLLGKGNMGIELDKLLNGKSYKEQEMNKKTGVIYSFDQTVFSVSMDLQEHIIKEKLEPKDFPNNNLSFISSVSYGRMGMLILESDFNVKDVRRVVNKLLGDYEEPLLGEDTTVLNELIATHIYFDKNGEMLLKRGGEDAILSYKNQVLKDIDNIFLYRFQVTDFFTPSMTTMNYSIVIE